MMHLAVRQIMIVAIFLFVEAVSLTIRFACGFELSMSSELISLAMVIVVGLAFDYVGVRRLNAMGNGDSDPGAML